MALVKCVRGPIYLADGSPLGAGDVDSADMSVQANIDLLDAGYIVVVDPLAPPPVPGTKTVSVRARVPFDAPAEYELDPSNLGAGGGSGLPSTVVTTTVDHAASAGELVQADAASGGLSVGLPTNPPAGTLVAVKKVDPSPNTVTITPAGGGSIDGDANATTTTQWAGAVFEHVGSNAWVIAASMTSQGAQGPAGATGPQGPTGAIGPSGLVIPLCAVGNWYSAPFYSSTSQATDPGTNAQIHFSPLLLSGAATFDQIGFRVNTAGTAGEQARMGIYASAPATGRPTGAPLVDAGTVATDTTGVKAITLGTPIALTAGFYWVAYVRQGTLGTAPLIDYGNTALQKLSTSQLLATSIASGEIRSTAASGFTGALPSVPALTEVGNVPLVQYQLRRSA